HNLLQFPETKSPNMSFGTAIHNTLQRAHNYLISTGNKQAIEDIVAIFEQNLIDQRLAKEDFDSLVRKGCDFIRTFMNEKYDSFNSSQMTELDFNHQNSLIGKAQITGKLDLVDMNKSSKTIIVTDYKTGKPSASWKGKDAYEKIKLHKYRQQLLFYKLLVENSRDYHGFSVEKGMIQFVQPDTFGNILAPLEIEFDEQELQNFARLVEAVWSQIINLELPDTSSYEQSIKGILAFEQDLIDN
ncbi:MAG: PD-(D/E)XK nuclease family protein, partial [Candidatus Saccharimonadaceae bacterium]|nr:PD-(D/E)XK nuclease family protein [Candidatus Saccharimonadaceae bacterium]